MWVGSIFCVVSPYIYSRKLIQIGPLIQNCYDLGLPPSPPLPPSDVTITDDGPYSGNDNNARTNKPLGVDLPRRQHKRGLSAGLLAIIVLSAIVAAVLCTAVVWILLIKHRKHTSQREPTPEALIPSGAKSSGNPKSTLPM